MGRRDVSDRAKAPRHGQDAPQRDEVISNGSPCDVFEPSTLGTEAGVTAVGARDAPCALMNSAEGRAARTVTHEFAVEVPPMRSPPYVLRAARSAHSLPMSDARHRRVSAQRRPASRDARRNSRAVAA